MTAIEIRAAAEKYLDRFGYVGVRTQEEPFELGSIDHLSNIWIDGDDTGEPLNGISATNIKSSALSMHGDGKESNFRRGYYYGDHIAIIAGNRVTFGEDEGEIIIEDAQVVEIIA